MMEKVFAIVLILFVCNFSLVENAKILGVFSMPAHSHFTVGYRLMRELADRGHEVTVINPYPHKTPVKNYRDVSVAEVIEPFESKFKGDLIDIDQAYLVNVIPYFYSMGEDYVNRTFQNPSVQNLFKDPKEKFDLVIMEQFLNEAFLYFPYHFKVPVVLVSSIGATAWNNHYVRNPAPLSHIPYIWLNTGPKMNLFQRVSNVFFTLYDDAIRHFIVFPNQDKILHRYHPEAPPLTELMKQVSLILLNSHPSYTEPVPHVPNMIEIGGYHVNPTGKLPQDLKDFLDQSPEGVVYFCMGSNLKTSQFPKEKQEAFLKSFAKLKQKVLWKFEADSLPNQPKNVKLVKWAPQQDILAHPNVKVFISHGGNLGSIEAVYFGVPVIGIPIFGDQKMNIANSVDRGYALSVSFKDLTEKTLSKALEEILGNKKYSENAKMRSKIMLDRKTKPIDEAVYWVEYAIRHKGAHHLNSSAMDLNWFEYNLLDIGVLSLLGLWFALKLPRCLCRKIRRATGLGKETGKEASSGGKKKSKRE